MEIIAHVRDYPELQRAAAALERFYEMYRELCDLSVSEPLDQFVGDVIAKSGYEAMLKAMKEEARPAARTWASWSAVSRPTPTKTARTRRCRAFWRRSR